MIGKQVGIGCWLTRQVFQQDYKPNSLGLQYCKQFLILSCRHTIIGCKWIILVPNSEQICNGHEIAS